MSGLLPAPLRSLLTAPYSHEGNSHKSNAKKYFPENSNPQLRLSDVATQLQRGTSDRLLDRHS